MQNQAKGTPVKLGQNIASERKRLGHSQRAVAASCEGLGLALARTRLANIEGGHRGAPVAVDEWLVLSRVLDVPPLQLLVGLNDEGYRGDDEVCEIAPSLSMAVGELRAWLAQGQLGAKAPPFIYGTVLNDLLRLLPHEHHQVVAENLGAILAKVRLT